MPKSSKKQINEDDMKFLKVFQKNSGDSLDKIAKKCGFSRQKISRIKKRLEKSKTVWGYHAVVDDEKLDRTRYIMLIKKSAQPVGNAVNKIIDLTMPKKGEEIGVDILSCGYLHGKYDWILIITAKDIKHVKKFSEILIREFQHVIREVDIMEYIFSIKECGITNLEIKKLREFF